MKMPVVAVRDIAATSIRVTQRVQRRDAVTDLQIIGRDFCSTTIRTFLMYRVALVVVASDIAYISAVGAGASDLVIRMTHWFEHCRAALKRKVKDAVNGS